MSDLNLNTSPTSLSLNTEIVTLEVRAPGQQSGGTVTNFSVSTALLQSFSVATPNTTPQLGIAGTIDTTRFLRNDGQWVTPPVGTGTVTNFLLSSALQAAFSVTSSTTTPTLGITGTIDTTRFLRNDGQWVTPPVGTGTVTNFLLSSALQAAFSVTSSTTTPTLGITGTIDNTRFLRNDGSWAVPPSGGGGITSIGLVVPSPLSVTPPTLTANGTFTVTWGTGQIPTTNLGTGTASINNYLRGDASWASPVVSLAKTGGTARTGALSLTQGTNVTITDNGDGSFTFASTGGGGGGGTSWTSVSNISIGDLVYATSPAGVQVAPGSTNVFDGSDVRLLDWSASLSATALPDTSAVNSFYMKNNVTFFGSNQITSKTISYSLDNKLFKVVRGLINIASEIEFFGGFYYVLSGSGQFIMRSSNLITWTQVFDNGTSAQGYNGGSIFNTGTALLVMMNALNNFSLSRILRSTDGTSFTPVFTVTSNTIYLFYKLNSLIIGLPNINVNLVYSSDDGQTFTTGGNPQTSQQTKAIVFSNNLVWISGSNRNQYSYTSDGITVNTISLTNNTHTYLATSGSSIVFCYNNSNVIYQITSLGQSATSRSLSVTMNPNNQLFFDDGRYWIFDSTNLVSGDVAGVSWTLQTSSLPAIGIFFFYFKSPFYYLSTQLESQVANFYQNAIQNQLIVSDSEGSQNFFAPVGTYRFLGGTGSQEESGLWTRTA